ncbi:hypothetical protein P152DRAFT_462097 [Eremomyces bilateralis CBS 781.70]|uniref:Uncharacterized protein n=1 Tax=Eremomyces bilateralis CBS 781.70 TaxID=1392243 RepID=A0A6G1FSV2_9PEZI|nr:uncharacterized protein P152DRAFT_462097 [Eremomyces bilateralis CBS 781.70]KAF1808867.1 hypothetical protein P152DRAFT_462097 [Eremomyces bilateralis CBS 781.70]
MPCGKCRHLLMLCYCRKLFGSYCMFVNFIISLSNCLPVEMLGGSTDLEGIGRL